MKRIFAFGLALILCICSLVIPASAAGTAGGTNYGVATDSTTFNRNHSEGENSNAAVGTGTDGKNTSSSYFGDIPSAEEVLGMNSENRVTTDDLNNWVDRKGGDLIVIVTRVAQIAAILGFFGSLFLIIVGALGNKRTMVAGFVALIISALVFTAATCAPQIMTAVRGWLIT